MKSNKFWIVLTNLDNDNLEKTLLFMCFLKKFTKILGGKKSRKGGESPVNSETDICRNDLAVLRDEMTYLKDRPSVYQPYFYPQGFS